MQYLVAPSNGGWPKLSDCFWEEAASWDDLADKLSDNFTVLPAENPQHVDYKRYLMRGAIPFVAYEPTPRMFEIHNRNLCCSKAVVVPCMCAVAYMCPEHRPTRQQCVGTHD